MNGSYKFWKILPTAALGVAAFTLTTEAAQAFFPPLPIGSEVVTVSPPAPIGVIPVNPTVPVDPIDPPIVPPVVPPLVPPVPPPPFVPPPPPVVTPTEEPEVCDCSPPTVPQTVPEPATILSGALGLSALAGLGLKRRLQSKSKA